MMEKAGIWKLVSSAIRWRDDWTCQICRVRWPVGTGSLHAAHLHTRHKASVYFDPENLDCLCFWCHSQGMTAHTAARRLHWDQYELRSAMLRARANTPRRPDLESIQQWAQMRLDQYREGRIAEFDMLRANANKKKHMADARFRAKTQAIGWQYWDEETSQLFILSPGYDEMLVERADGLLLGNKYLRHYR